MMPIHVMNQVAQILLVENELNIIEKIFKRLQVLLLVLLYKTFSIFIILFVGFVIYRIIRHFIRKYFKAKVQSQRKKTISSTIETTLKYLVVFICSAMILETLGVSVSTLLAMSSIGTFAIGFGAQSLVADVISGVLILIDNDFRVGDYVLIKETEGDVVEIGIRTTKVRNNSGALFIIPNSVIKTVINQTKGYRRAIVLLPIAYDMNIDKTIAKITTALEEYDGPARKSMLTNPRVSGINEFDVQGMQLQIACRTIAEDNLNVERALRFYLKDYMEKNQIEMSYMKQDLSSIYQK